jgi:hypothetical protein
VKTYTVAQRFWRQGILLEVGEKLRLTDAEAKHIKHLLSEVKADEAPPAPQPSAARPKEVPAPRDGKDPEAIVQQAKIVAAVKARKAH